MKIKLDEEFENNFEKIFKHIIKDKISANIIVNITTIHKVDNFSLFVISSFILNSYWLIIFCPCISHNA